MPVRLADLTTLRLGGPASQFVPARTTEDIVSAVRAADMSGEAMLILGGGSNLVVADDGWPGVVVQLASDGVAVQDTGDDVVVRVDAGVQWDSLVARSIEEAWAGLASMSGIPGLTGATPVQNVGAYGSEVSELIEDVTVYDRSTSEIVRLSARDCGFGFRTSAFKATDRFVVLDVAFRLHKSPDSCPIRYVELARRLGVAQGDTVPSKDVRAAVLDLRRSKGMVLDASDHDTWSVGSFFVNPLVPAATAPDGCPHWTVDGRIGDLKLSAAWLIERSGFPRGYGLGLGRGRVAISTKHSLALTNRGGATTAELLGLARTIRDGVERTFGVRLRPEPRLAGVSLD